MRRHKPETTTTTKTTKKTKTEQEPGREQDSRIPLTLKVRYVVCDASYQSVSQSVYQSVSQVCDD